MAGGIIWLCSSAMTEREVRSIACHMKAARFRANKDLSGFSFSDSEINEALVQQLHRCEFMEGAVNVVPIGRPGAENSHTATTPRRSGHRASGEPLRSGTPQGPRTAGLRLNPQL